MKPDDLKHAMQGSPGWRCSCGASFRDYGALAEHVRLSINCPRCGAAPMQMHAAVHADLVAALDRRGNTLGHASLYAQPSLFRWTCGHWIAKGDTSAKIHTTPEEKP